MKLVWEPIQLKESCRNCVKIKIKEGRIRKEHDKIKRWKQEGRNRTSIQCSEEAIDDLTREIMELTEQRTSVQYSRNNY